MVASSSRPICLVNKPGFATLRVVNPEAASLSVVQWVAGIFLPYKREDWRRCAFVHATCCYNAVTKNGVQPSNLHQPLQDSGPAFMARNSKNTDAGTTARDMLCTLLQFDVVGHVDSLVGRSVFLHAWSVSILVQSNKTGPGISGEPCMGLVEPIVLGIEVEGLLVSVGVRASMPWPISLTYAHVQAYLLSTASALAWAHCCSTSEAFCCLQSSLLGDASRLWQRLSQVLQNQSSKLVPMLLLLFPEILDEQC